MFVLFCYVLLHLCGTSSLAQSVDHPIGNLYVFGDSTVDSGYKHTHAAGLKTGYFPYGIECIWIGQYRFTNGKTIPEFVASALNFRKPQSIDDAYLYPDSGVIYASASAGILPETGNAFGTNYGMDQQVNLFRGTIDNKLRPKYPSARRLYEYLSNSIFLIHIGSSDYIYNYLQSDKYNSSRQYNGETFSELLTTKLGNQLKDLYELGARKMVVFQLGPLGCLPYIMNKVKPTSKCAEDVNKLVSIFNGKLNVKIKELSKKLEGSSFVTAKTFDLVKSMIQNPADYGFQEIRWPCCATQENGTGLCKEPDWFGNKLSPEVEKAMRAPNVEERVALKQFQCLDLPPLNLTMPRTKDGKPLGYFCPERKLYLFFDEVHMTEGAYKIIANQCLNSNSTGICSPYGINHLAEI